MWVMGQLHVYQHLFPFNQSKDDKWDVMCPMARDGEVSGVEQREDSGNLTRGLMPADSRQARVRVRQSNMCFVSL